MFSLKEAFWIQADWAQYAMRPKTPNWPDVTSHSPSNAESSPDFPAPVSPRIAHKLPFLMDAVPLLSNGAP